MLRPIHIVALIAINIIFSGAYIAGKFGVNHFPPLFFSGLRFLLVFLALLPFFRWHPVPRSHLKPFLGFCFSMGIGVYASMYLALSLTDGVSAILIGTQFSVPMAALLGIWWLGDKVSGVTWLGIILAFTGVMIVGFDGAILGYGAAFALIILSAFFYASANVLSKKVDGKVGVLNLNAWMALLSVPPMFLLSFVFEKNQWQALITADIGDWGALLYSALVVTLVGHCGMFILLRRYPVALVMPYYVLMPIFGVVGSIVMFDETPTFKFYIGAVVALSGVWLVNVIGKRQRRRRLAA